MWKFLDKAVSALIRRIFRLRYYVAHSETHQLPGRTRTVRWCTAPAGASENDLRRIFATIDEPKSDDMAVWFYSSLEDIGKKPYDVALIERQGKGSAPIITRPAGFRKEVNKA